VPVAHATCALPSHLLPGAHERQLLLLLRYDPAPHVLQVLWPVSSWYSTAPLHAAHGEPDADAVPAGQSVHAELVTEPSKLPVPAGHAVQLSVPNPTSVLKRPAWHSVHCSCPGWSWKRPALQSKQLTSSVFASGKYVPAAQMVHCVRWSASPTTAAVDP
jgi:hypothetical protein